jgi:hypothetical protein
MPYAYACTEPPCLRSSHSPHSSQRKYNGTNDERRNDQDKTTTMTKSNKRSRLYFILYLIDIRTSRLLDSRRRHPLSLRSRYPLYILLLHQRGYDPKKVIEENTSGPIKINAIATRLRVPIITLLSDPLKYSSCSSLIHTLIIYPLSQPSPWRIIFITNELISPYYGPYTQVFPVAHSHLPTVPTVDEYHRYFDHLSAVLMNETDHR